MRENRPYGSEGGGPPTRRSPYPYFIETRDRVYPEVRQDWHVSVPASARECRSPDPIAFCVISYRRIWAGLGEAKQATVISFQ